MTKKFYKFSSFILSISLIFIIGCGDDPEPGLFPTLVNPDQLAPIITAVNPPNLALAGITTLTITGQNFAPNQEDNRIYFNGVRGEIESSSTTQIVVKAPLVVADTVKIKVSCLKLKILAMSLSISCSQDMRNIILLIPIIVNIPGLLLLIIPVVYLFLYSQKVFTNLQIHLEYLFLKVPKQNGML